MKLPLTATALVCVGAAGVAVGALVLEPAKPAAAPAPAAAVAPAVSAPPAGTTPAGYPTSAAGTGTPAASAPTAPAASAPVAPAATAEISGFAFATAPVAPGAAVTVTNRDSAGHTFTADEFDTGTIDGGSSATFTAPAAAGSYSIVCLIHPSMTGTFVVA
jgi:plastocyanin